MEEVLGSSSLFTVQQTQTQCKILLNWNLYKPISSTLYHSTTKEQLSIFSSGEPGGSGKPVQKNVKNRPSKRNVFSSFQQPENSKVLTEEEPILNYIECQKVSDTCMRGLTFLPLSLNSPFKHCFVADWLAIVPRLSPPVPAYYEWAHRPLNADACVA